MRGIFEVEGDDVRLEFGDFAQGEGAVHGCADDLDVRITLKDQRNQLPHKGGIVDDQDSDAIFHAIGSEGMDRECRKDLPER